MKVEVKGKQNLRDWLERPESVLILDWNGSVLLSCLLLLGLLLCFELFLGFVLLLVEVAVGDEGHAGLFFFFFVVLWQRFSD